MFAMHRIAAGAVIVALVAGLAACGGTGTRDAKVTDATMTDTMAMTDSSAAVTTTDAKPAEGTGSATTVTVELGKGSEYAVQPSVDSVPAGPVTFNVNNDGTMLHELVVVKTAKTPAQLAEPDGTANESESVGEAADIEPGASKSVTLNLKPGHYVLLCNLPGHYAGGMYVEFTVTAKEQAIAPVSGVTDVSVALAAASPYSLEPSVAKVKAGKVRFISANYGTMTHEVVVVKTDKTPAQLAEPDGTANESTSVGEAADIAAGETKMFTADLKPGRYILLCNLPGHYAGGMFATFVVE